MMALGACLLRCFNPLPDPSWAVREVVVAAPSTPSQHFQVSDQLLLAERFAGEVEAVGIAPNAKTEGGQLPDEGSDATLLSLRHTGPVKAAAHQLASHGGLVDACLIEALHNGHCMHANPAQTSTQPRLPHPGSPPQSP